MLEGNIQRTNAFQVDAAVVLQFFDITQIRIYRIIGKVSFKSQKVLEIGYFFIPGHCVVFF